MQWKTRAAYAAVYTAWGSTFFAIKIGVSHFSASGMAGLRFVLAGSMLYGLRRWLKRGRTSLSSREAINAGVVGCVILAGGTGCLGYAERTVPSGVCSLVMGCSPILFAVFNRMAGGSKLTPHQTVGGLLSLAGVAVLSLSGSSWSGGAAPLTDLGLLFFGMFCWVSASVASKHVALPKDTMVMASVQMLAAGALLLCVGRLRGEFLFSDIPRLRTDTAVAIVYLASVGSCLGFTAYAWLLHHEPANRVSSYAFVNPIVAVFLGVMFGGEAFTLPIAVAVAMVLGGVSLSLFGWRWKRIAPFSS